MHGHGATHKKRVYFRVYIVSECIICQATINEVTNNNIIIIIIVGKTTFWYILYKMYKH